MKNVKKGTKGVYWFSFVVLAIIIYKVLDNFTGISLWVAEFLQVIKPFLMAVLFAYLLYIPCRKIENLYLKSKLLKKRARGLAVLTTYLLVVLVIAILINTIFPILSESIIDLAGNLPLGII